MLLALVVISYRTVDSGVRIQLLVRVVAGSVFVVVLFLVPSAFVTSRFQRLFHKAASARPFCSDPMKQIELERLVILLEPYGIGTGVELAGVVVSATMVRSVVVVMYTLLFASSLW